MSRADVYKQTMTPTQHLQAGSKQPTSRKRFSARPACSPPSALTAPECRTLKTRTWVVLLSVCLRPSVRPSSVFSLGTVNVNKREEGNRKAKGLIKAGIYSTIAVAPLWEAAAQTRTSSTTLLRRASGRIVRQRNRETWPRKHTRLGGQRASVTRYAGPLC